MECTIFEKYLKENECNDTATSVEMHKHLVACKDCQQYNRFVLALNVGKGSLEKAPEDILLTIEKKIVESAHRVKNKEPFALFQPLFKPAFAGFFAVLVAIVSYTYLANKNIGYVENLSERFKLSQFENIKSGDMLYAGDNTTAAIRLKSKNTLQIHHNTVVRVKGPRYIALSRGEISLVSGDKELQVETPDGLLLARNTNTKITTVARLENGLLKTETICIVFKGKLIIKCPSKEIILNQGQKAILAENGSISLQNHLTAIESESEKSADVKQKMFAAVASLCDCIQADNYAPGKKGNHLEVFGKEKDENKYKVHVFWKEKGLNEQGFGAFDENNKICSVKSRRVHV
jgi:hypothetical protein